LDRLSALPRKVVPEIWQPARAGKPIWETRHFPLQPPGSIRAASDVPAIAERDGFDLQTPRSPEQPPQTRGAAVSRAAAD